MKVKRNFWPFSSKKRPRAAASKTARSGRALKPVSERARAAVAKAQETERLERKLSDAQLEAKLRKHYARGGNLREFLQGNPGLPGDQFKRCVAAVAARGGAIDPPAVCAAAGRKKYGAKKFAAMAAAGRKSSRKNPADEAAAVYEEFHGRPSEEVVIVQERIHYHKNLAALGELRTLVVRARDGSQITLSRFRRAILCTNEAKNQMFIRGGDQSVDVAMFGVASPHEVETLGVVMELAYFTRKDHLGDEGGTAVYFHVAGETNENGRRKMAGWGPDLIYHTLDQRLEFSGGSYTILREGVDR